MLLKEVHNVFRSIKFVGVPNRPRSQNGFDVGENVGELFPVLVHDGHVAQYLQMFGVPAAACNHGLILARKLRDRQSERLADLPSVNHCVARVDKFSLVDGVHGAFQVDDPWVHVEDVGVQK